MKLQPYTAGKHFYLHVYIVLFAMRLKKPACGVLSSISCRGKNWASVRDPRTVSRNRRTVSVESINLLYKQVRGMLQ